MSLLVSINCITYNHEDYIEDAIKGFLRQKTDFDFEILIGEDCSTDMTRKIVEKYTRKYPNLIKLITSDQNVGGRKNSQRLRDNSKGKYIAVCEGDDYWTDPYKLKKQIEYMEENPLCTVCFHAVKRVSKQGKQIGVEKPFANNRKTSIEEVILNGGGFMPSVSRTYRRAAVKNLPQFYFEAPVGDYPMQIILANRGYAYYMNEIMAAYRINSSGSWSDTKKTDQKYRREWRKGTLKMLDEVDKYTSYNYTEIIDKTKIKVEIEQHIDDRKIKKIRENRYKNYINNFPLKKKYKLYARAYFPKTYDLLAKIKGRK